MITLIESSHPFSPHIARARESVSDTISGVGRYIESGVSRWITFERGVERELKCIAPGEILGPRLEIYYSIGEVKAILPPDESLTPGIIYVLISGLSASVITRTRSLPLRFLSPPLFTLAAMPYFLPKTSRNIRSYLSEVEDHHFPSFAAKHDQFTANATTHTEQLVIRFGRVSEDASRFGRRAVQSVEDATGLKVGEAVKRGQEKVEREKQRQMKDDQAQVGQVEKLGYVVEQKPVAEIVVPVTPTRNMEQPKRYV